MTILVTGSTGGVGGTLARALVAAGHRPRVVLRPGSARAAPPGVEVFEGDLWRAESLRPALEGVERVFLYAQGEASALAAELKAAGVRQVVVLSTIDAGNPKPYAAMNRQRHLAYEDAVRAQGLAFTFLRPGAFASNAARFWGPQIAARSAVRLPYPGAQQAPIHEADLAEVALAALTGEALASRTLVLTGPESLSQREQVAILSSTLGRPIAVEEISRDEARRQLLAARVPDAYVELLLSQWEDEVDVPAEVTPVVEQVTGHPARTYAQWAAEHLGRFS